MKVLLAAPCVYSIRGLKEGRYGGMEKLTVLLAMGLREMGHEPTIVGARGSRLDGIQVLEGTRSGTFQQAEWAAFLEHKWLLPYQDVVLDMSHSHYFREGGKPGLSFIWHDPKIMQPPVPYSEVYALSQWQADRHLEMTRQQIDVLDCICAPTDTYHYDARAELGDRWVSIGILDDNKGQYEAVQLAKWAGIRLDVIGKTVKRSIQQAIEYISAETDGRIFYRGEVSEEDKMRYLRRARGLIYVPSYQEGFGEAHSHKMVEALMMGVPCFSTGQGAIQEVFGGQVGATITDTVDTLESEVALAEGSTLPQQDFRERIAQAATERWGYRAVSKRVAMKLGQLAGVMA